MPHENLIYAVNAHQLSNNEQEDIIIMRASPGTTGSKSRMLDVAES